MLYVLERDQQEVPHREDPELPVKRLLGVTGVREHHLLFRQVKGDGEVVDLGCYSELRAGCALLFSARGYPLLWRCVCQGMDGLVF